MKEKKYLLLAFCVLGLSQIALGAPHIASGTGTGSVIIADAPNADGQENEASGGYSSAIGIGNKATGKKSFAFGYENRASGNWSSAFGHWNKAIGGRSSAFGYGNVATGGASSVFGSEYGVTGDLSGAWGVGELTSGNYVYKNEGRASYMLGNRNQIAAGTSNNFIMGNGVSIGAGVNNAVVLGYQSTDGGSDTVSVGSASKQRRIVNVAEGTQNTDAVNLKQVKDLIGTPIDAYTKAESDAKFATKTEVNTLNGKVADHETRIIALEGLSGDITTLQTNINSKADKDASNLGNAEISAWKNKLGLDNVISNTATGTGSTGLGHGNVVAGNYSTAVGYQNNVSGNHSGAFGDPNNISGNYSYAVGNDNTIAGDNNFVLGNNVNIGAGIQNSVALGNNSTVSASNEVSVGAVGKERKITNVADGEVSATSTDAVTGKQLFAVSKGLGVEELRKEMKHNKKELRGIGSLSAALAGLHPMQYDKNAPSQVMAALGNYKDKQAIAVGVSHYFTPNAMMSAGVALSNEKRTNAMANVGFTLKLGKGGSQVPMENASVVQSEVRRLTLENQKLQSQVNSQGVENKELKARVQKLEEALNTLLKK